jgi:hypothetical protein
MPKSKTSKSAKKPRQSMDPERKRKLIKLSIHLMLAITIFGGLGAGYIYADRYVDQKIAFNAQPLIVVVRNRPPWMNHFLVEQIAAIARPLGAHSSFDHQMLVDTAELLSRNPWISNVRSVRRAYTHKPGDTLEIDCDYRAPVALVKYGAFYWLVDEKGVRLSDRFTEQDVPNIQFDPAGHTRIRVIEGVQRSVPQLAGDPWQGDDLKAGLKMIGYLFDKPYTEQILRVNVGNSDGHVDAKDPRLVLTTSFGTQIWWGRPPGDDVDSFIEVSTARKFYYLRTIFEETGRVDGKHKWIDIRFDKATCPPDEDPPPVISPNKKSRAAH